MAMFICKVTNKGEKEVEYKILSTGEIKKLSLEDFKRYLELKFLFPINYKLTENRRLIPCVHKYDGFEKMADDISKKRTTTQIINDQYYRTDFNDSISMVLSVNEIGGLTNGYTIINSKTGTKLNMAGLDMVEKVRRFIRDSEGNTHHMSFGKHNYFDIDDNAYQQFLRVMKNMNTFRRTPVSAYFYESTRVMNEQVKKEESAPVMEYEAIHGLNLSTLLGKGYKAEINQGYLVIKYNDKVLTNIFITRGNDKLKYIGIAYNNKNKQFGLLVSVEERESRSYYDYAEDNTKIRKTYKYFPFIIA